MHQELDAARPRSRIARAILVGGAAAGAIDIVYAFIVYGMIGVGPLAILQSIASGILGRSAFTGGTTTALLGLTLHFAMTLVMAAFYVGASRTFRLLPKHPILFGLSYGLVIYGVMTYIVVPLSAYPLPKEFPSTIMLVGALAVHMLGVGLPIAYAAKLAGSSSRMPTRLAH